MNRILYITRLAYIDVLLDGKFVGKIRKTSVGWRYFPKGRHYAGCAFQTLSECKQSLEFGVEDK